MNWLADECCDASVVAGLRSDGHDVWFVAESMRGMDDRSILHTAFAQQRIVLTEDKDFGELVVRFKLQAHGLVLVRMDPRDSAGKLSRLRDLVRTDSSRLVGYFVVLEKDKNALSTSVKDTPPPRRHGGSLHIMT